MKISLDLAILLMVVLGQQAWREDNEICLSQSLRVTYFFDETKKLIIQKYVIVYI